MRQTNSIYPFKLKLPETTDQYSINDFNYNYNAIDTQLQQNPNFKVYKLQPAAQNEARNYGYDLTFTIPEIPVDENDKSLSAGTAVFFKIGQNANILPTYFDLPTDDICALKIRINDSLYYDVYSDWNLVSISNQYSFNKTNFYLVYLERYADPNVANSYKLQWNLYEVPNKYPGDESSSETIIYEDHAVDDVENVIVTVNNNVVSFNWSDPIDYIQNNVTTGKWYGTKLVIKAGSTPLNENDGTVICNNTIRNQYSNYSGNAFTYTLNYDTTYYYRFFPYTDKGIYTAGTYDSVIAARETISTVPSTSSSFTYDGTTKTPVWDNYDTTKMTISGQTSATDAGQYIVSFTPKTGYQWSDGTTRYKNKSWRIQKASRSLYGPTTGTVSGASGTTTTLTYYVSDATANEGFTVRFAGLPSNYSNYFSYSMNIRASGTRHYADITFTSKLTTYNTYSYSLEVCTDATNNYEQARKSLSLTVKNEPPCDLVTWADGTDYQIYQMVRAADQGKLDLNEYWSIGNERTVSLSAIAASGTYGGGSWAVSESHAAQNVVLVLMDKERFIVDTSTNKTDNFVVGQKDCLAETAYLNSDGSKQYWELTDRPSWCSYGYYSAFSTYMKSTFKTFRCSSYAPDKSGNPTLNTSTVRFSLFATKEIYGSVGMGYTVENAFTQMQYYKTASHRYKKLGINGSSNTSWWTRTKVNDDVTIRNAFCYCRADADAMNLGTNNVCGLAPFGVI